MLQRASIAVRFCAPHSCHCPLPTEVRTTDDQGLLEAVGIELRVGYFVEQFIANSKCGIQLLLVSSFGAPLYEGGMISESVHIPGLVEGGGKVIHCFNEPTVRELKNL